MITLEQITEHLNNLDDSMLVVAWNDYQSNISGDASLYEFEDDFFQIFFSNPIDAARAVHFGNIQAWNDDYIYFNGYANLESTSNPSEVISIDELADYINDNQHLFDYIINEIEEIDEEDV